MSNTMPSPARFENRIPNRLSHWNPKPLSLFVNATTDASILWAVYWSTSDVTAMHKRLCEYFSEIGTRLLANEGVIPFSIAVHSEDVDTTYPLPWSELQPLTMTQSRAREEDEWENYGEPLMDPLDVEVALIIEDYFKQADADSERANT